MMSKEDFLSVINKEIEYKRNKVELNLTYDIAGVPVIEFIESALADISKIYQTASIEDNQIVYDYDKTLEVVFKLFVFRDMKFVLKELCKILGVEESLLISIILQDKFDHFDTFQIRFNLIEIQNLYISIKDFILDVTESNINTLSNLIYIHKNL